MPRFPLSPRSPIPILAVSPSLRPGSLPASHTTLVSIHTGIPLFPASKAEGPSCLQALQPPLPVIWVPLRNHTSSLTGVFTLTLLSCPPHPPPSMKIIIFSPTPRLMLLPSPLPRLLPSSLELLATLPLHPLLSHVRRKPLPPAAGRHNKFPGHDAAKGL